MNIHMAILVGVLFAAGVFLILRRNMVKLVVGFIVLGHASNLLVLVAGGLSVASPPLIPEGASIMPEPFANPLPQALVLTAIVIGLAVQAFVLVLVCVMIHTNDAWDVERSADRPRGGGDSRPAEERT